MIYLCPQAGTCNRIRAIASAVSLAKSCGDELCVYWIDDQGMHEKFSEIFEDGGWFKLVEGHSETMDARFQTGGEWAFGQCDFCDSKNITAVIEKILKKPRGQDVFISTFSHFYGEHDYSWLAFNSRIQGMAEDIRRQFGTNCIGVHVRRTDNVKSRAYSPIGLFIDVMQEEVDRDNQTRFFLATDSEAVRRVLSARFGARILTRSGVSSRFAPDGVVDGAVDLMLLSRTKKIYGSYWSSFSEEAAHMGKIPCMIVRDSWQDPVRKIAECNDLICKMMLEQMQFDVAEWSKLRRRCDDLEKEHKMLKRQFTEAAGEAMRLKNSESYRIGLFISRPMRCIYRILRGRDCEI